MFPLLASILFLIYFTCDSSVIPETFLATLSISPSDAAFSGDKENVTISDLLFKVEGDYPYLGFHFINGVGILCISQSRFMYNDVS